MPDSRFDQFLGFLKPDGPVAIVIKQSLAPVNADDPVIFPPSYPMTALRGRVHTIRDGDYRVTVELPPDSKSRKGEKSAEQRPGYNIDRFPDGTNSCEIDSPQSQANRIEPIFKGEYRELVPQVEIAVGSNGTKVNLLDAGHRAADAVVRLSSLADKFHEAFLDVKKGDHFTLATLAPTSLLFGAWDSRSTNVKMQRVIKAYIRASNVYERTKSAQFTPAIDYVAAGAIDGGLNSGEGEENPLSEQGMLHALATQTVGGVMLTDKSALTRTVVLNLAALRDLKGSDDEETRDLQRYLLGLALAAASYDVDLNLREGCNLRYKSDRTSKIPRRGEEEPISLDLGEVKEFATSSAREFFRRANIEFDRKDHLNAVFEKGAAEEFLGLGKADREKLSRLGPITAATLKRFRETKQDPFKLAGDRLTAAKKALGKAPRKNQPSVVKPDALKPLAEALESLSTWDDLSEEERGVVGELLKLAEGPEARDALKKIDAMFNEVRKAHKGGGTQPEAPAPPAQ
jgi:CRISPR-associated protein Csb1